MEDKAFETFWSTDEPENDVLKPLEHMKVSDQTQVQILSQLTLIGVKDFITLCYCVYSEFNQMDETFACVKKDHTKLKNNLKYFEGFTLEVNSFTNNQFVIGLRHIKNYA